MDGLVAALAATPLDRRFNFAKNFTPQATGQWFALFNATGTPGAGATPSSGLSGDIPTDATAGSFPFTNPTPPVLNYLGYASGVCSQVGTIYLYDRLWHNSGISSTILTAQTINSVALTRPDANGVGAEVWWQVYATMGAGAPVVTLSYTQQGAAGASGRSASSGTMVTLMTTGRTGPFTLQAGDLGVKSIQSWTANATFTSGTIGLVIRRKIGAIPITAADGGIVLDAIQNGLPAIPDDACMELVMMIGNSGAQWLLGSVVLAQG